MPPKTLPETPRKPEFKGAPETPTEKIPVKTSRLRYIRSHAAEILSKALGKTFNAGDITFTTCFRSGYDWYVGATTIIDAKTGVGFTTEYQLPMWAEAQMWRWKSHEASAMIEWIDSGLLKAEKVVGKARKVREQLPDEVAGSKDIEVMHMAALAKKEYIKEVCIVVLNEREKKALKGRWIQPPGTIKGPASEFLAWMAGSAGPSATQRMSREYLGMDSSGGEGEGRGIRISHGGFGGDPIVTEAPTDEDFLKARELAKNALAYMELSTRDSTNVSGVDAGTIDRFMQL
ncbi:hypothetical protein TWF481_009103 [Arthrobotrys musiformis]|uniref:Uncharacterized protein n=1 Tax=Arthrobotrys musiformis TaxID=47236 RepID=A0AAV9W2K8_9PEZI